MGAVAGSIVRASKDVVAVRKSIPTRDESLLTTTSTDFRAHQNKTRSARQM